MYVIFDMEIAVIIILLGLIYNTHVIRRKLDRITDGLNSIKDQNNKVDDQ